jgi:hypothetical protein
LVIKSGHRYKIEKIITLDASLAEAGMGDDAANRPIETALHCWRQHWFRLPAACDRDIEQGNFRLAQRPGLSLSQGR